MKKSAACRLYVIFARESPMAIILRRGPTIWTQLVCWDTANDTFEEGHWFKGSVYPERCDLSPSGSKFIYASAKYYNFHQLDTTISNPPYFTSLAIWSFQGGTCLGGGLFTTDDAIQLNSVSMAYFGTIHEPHPVTQLPPQFRIEPFPTPWLIYRSCDINPECLRMLRDGWTWHEDGRQTVSLAQLQQRSEADLPVTRNLYRYGGRPDGGYAVLHREVTESNGKVQFSCLIHPGTQADARDDLLEDVEWADFDRRGRLICAAKGKLYVVELNGKGAAREWREIADFNDNRPRLFPPPDSARVW